MTPAAPNYDHFHARYKLADGSIDELEGGFTGWPADWTDKTKPQRDEYRKQLAIDWGMPPDSELQAFWLAG